MRIGIADSVLPCESSSDETDAITRLGHEVVFVDAKPDWLIDDDVARCEQFDGYALLVTRPHNRLATTHIKRIKSLADAAILLQYVPVGGYRPYGFISTLKVEDVHKMTVTNIPQADGDG